MGFVDYHNSACPAEKTAKINRIFVSGKDMNGDA